jgi:hypothetical protein
MIGEPSSFSLFIPAYPPVKAHTVQSPAGAAPQANP